MNPSTDQARIEALRKHYALQGINYDKATRRFLDTHVDSERPTIEIDGAALSILLLNASAQ